MSTKEEIEAAVKWIESNLPTRSAWTLQDYRDFYMRDVGTLLKVADAYLADREQQTPQSILTRAAELAERTPLEDSLTVANWLRAAADFWSNAK